MEKNSKILSEITIFNKYAKYIPEKNRRETWEELIDRNKEMHIKKFPYLKHTINKYYENLVKPKKILPSMRSLQFGGKPIEVNPSRIFNCFSKDTEFITSEGVKSFEDYSEGETISVLSKDGTWNDAIVRCYGEDHLNEITFSKGQTKKIIKATKNHRWLLKNGKETTNLSLHEQLDYTEDILSKFDFDSASVSEKLYWCYGFVFGDGTVTSDKKYSMLRLCGNDVVFEKRFLETGFKSSGPKSIDSDIIVYTEKYIKTSPNPNIDSPELIRAFVLGYLQADGEKNNDPTMVNSWKSIQSSQKDHWEFIEKCFPIAGIYINTKTDLIGQITNYGTRPETYKYSLYHKIGKTNSDKWSVTEIKESQSLEKVYCLEVNNTKNFVLASGMPTGNCAFLPIEDYHAFSETMFLLLGGTGVGYSVQKRHIEKLPKVLGPKKNKYKRYLVGDSIEGWSDAIKILFKSYFEGTRTIKFDFSDIREKGMPLITSGGKAPGPKPLEECLLKLKYVLEDAIGRSLYSLEVHDIQCFIADAVLAGGIRRAAMISLFDKDDLEMLACKSGNWFEINSQRSRANNSVILDRNTITEEEFKHILKQTELSKSGEPGIYWTNNLDWGTNPCGEISLRPYQFCNLVEINVNDIISKEDFYYRCEGASFISTLQASYTNFHYLRPIWEETTKKDSLIGISMTGIASEKLIYEEMKFANNIIKQTNKDTAKKICINEAARKTCVKPAGTTSLVFGTSSGIHAWHSKYYLRRLRLLKTDPLYDYLLKNYSQLIEDEVFRPFDTAVISVPIKAPKGAVTRKESVLNLLERIKNVYLNWIIPGHKNGENKNNISATVNIKDNEWEKVINWMWENKEFYNGISLFPYDGGSYVQAPHEDITKEQYEELSKNITSIDLMEILEYTDETNLTEQLACAGGFCEIT